MMQRNVFEEAGRKNLDCKQQNSLYGSKQAPFIWYRHFNSCPESLSKIVLLHFDIPLVKTENENRIFVVVRIEDLQIISRRTQLVKHVNPKLVKNVRVEDLGSVNSFLGVEIASYTGYFVLWQTYSIETITY